MIAIVAAVVGCSSSGCSSSGNGGLAFDAGPTDFFGTDGVDRGEAPDLQSGGERGTGGLFAKCHADNDCAHGFCSLNGTSGICLSVCAVADVVPRSFPVEPCARGEECVAEKRFGISFCMMPCDTNRDCTVPRTECDRVPGATGQWCQPRTVSEDTSH